MRVEITEMTAAHIPKLAELEKECFSTPWTAEGLAQELCNPQAHFLVAEAQGEAVGYLGVQEIVGEGYITNIAVFPQYRGQGIAAALLQSAAEGAAERDCSFLTLEVRESNAPAIALYKKMGYTDVGQRKNFYRDPTENARIYTKYLKDVHHEDPCN